MTYYRPVKGVRTRVIDMAKDPVCGMEVDPKTSSYVMEYNGGSYYFCSENCLNEFKKDPEKYLRGGGESHGGHRHGGGCCGMMMGGGWATYAFLGFMLLLLIIRFFW